MVWSVKVAQYIFMVYLGFYLFMNLSCIAHLNVIYLFLFFNRMNLAKCFPVKVGSPNSLCALVPILHILKKVKYTL